MNNTPLGWRRVVRRITRALAPDHARTTLGDLLEEFRSDRRKVGLVRASWHTWHDALSITRAYANSTSPGFAGWPGFARWIDAFGHDVRSAVMITVRQPALTATVILVLTLALSANTALFSIVDGLLFRPLPFRDSNALLQLRVKPESGVLRSYSKYVGLIESVASSPLLSGVSLASGNLVFAADAAAAAGVRPEDVSPGYFTLLGLPLHRGRDFTIDDARQAVPHVVVTHDVWQERFGEEARQLGRVATLAERQVVVVGVVPSGQTYPLGANVWTVSETPISQSNGVRFWRLGRLAEGVALEQFRSRFPDVSATPLRDAIQPGDVRALVFLLGGTLLLLLTACVQVGSLLLARAVGRLAEITVRLALGISPNRLARQHLLDATVLAVLAVGLSWLAAPLVTRSIAAQLPEAVTLGQAIDPDRRTLVYTSATGILVILLLGWTPWSLVRRMTRDTVSAGSMLGLRVRADTWREGLLVAQVASSSLLLCIAGLALHSFVRVSKIDPGFDVAGLWQVSVPHLPAGLGSDQRQAARQARLVEAETIRTSLLAMPSVEVAGLGGAPPLSTIGRWVVYIAGRSDPLPVEPAAHRVTLDYLLAMRARLVAGRLPRPNPSASEPEELVVNRATARLWPPDVDLMTADIQLAGARGRIVGVVDDLMGRQPGGPDEPRVFVPMGRTTPGTLLVRAATDDPAVGTAIETVVARTWPGGTSARVTRASEELARIAAPWRARTILFGVIAGLCVPMVVAGLCGMLVSSVRHRWRELAIRIALGASSSAIHRSVLWRAWRPVTIGLLAGLGSGVLTASAMTGLLFEIPSTDWVTLAMVTAFILGITTAAALWPARLASSVAPVDALRER